MISFLSSTLGFIVRSSLGSIVFLPNPAVKGTRRPHRFLRAGGFFGFVGFALVHQPARPLLLR